MKRPSVRGAPRTFAQRAMSIATMVFLVATQSCTSCGTVQNSPSGIEGTVFDLDGRPLADVHVTIEATGTTAVTASAGSFSISVPPGRAALASFSANGYVEVQRRVEIAAGVMSFVHVRLAQEGAAHPLDATHGGIVKGTRGTSFSVPGAAFVHENGATAFGSVDVRMTPLDPSVASELVAYPGTFRAVRGDLSLAAIRSFGVVAIRASTAAGESLRLGPGMSAIVSIPASAQMQTPASAPLWNFDPATGEWREQGVASFDADAHAYVATVHRLSWWTVAEPIDTTCVRGIVVDASGRPRAGVSVRAEGTESAGEVSMTHTAGDGNFCLSLRRSAHARLVVETPDRNERTTVGFTSGTLRTDYPATCAVFGCMDLGPITLGAPPSIAGPMTGACDATGSIGGDPLAGTCAATLGEVFACFRPQGACTYRVDPAESGVEIRFANGARMRSENGTAFAYYGPDGTRCGGIEAGQDITRITDRLGASYEVRSTTTGATELACASDSTITLSPAQRRELSACAADFGPYTPGSTAGIPCTPEPRSHGSACGTAADCDDGTLCCEALNAPICLEWRECAYYRAHGCTCDSDCARSERCCSLLGYHACIPGPSCP